MDVLTKKQLRLYEKLSRYQNVPFYYHLVDNKYIMGTSYWLKTSTNYIEHTIVKGDTLDSLAALYYGSPTYYWIIADFNRLLNPICNLPVGFIVKIPTFTTIEFED